MSNVRLPLELCELIIDFIREPRLWPKRSFNDAPSQALSHFLACAVVCSAWLPRARRHLYYRIAFTRQPQVELLIRSIKENPPLADIVREVVLSPREYIPFVHATLIRRLRHLHTLVYELPTLGTNSGEWPYPPSYHLLITQFPLTELAVRYSFGPLAKKAWFEMFRLIWSLRSLESLYLELCHLPDLTDSELQRLTAILRPTRIKSLVIEVRNKWQPRYLISLLIAS